MVMGLKQPMPCLGWGDRGSVGSVGLEWTPGSTEPSLRGSVLQHARWQAGRQAAARGSQHPCTGWAGAGDGRVSHGSTGKAWAVGCSWVILVPPKNGMQKGNTPHRQQETEKGDSP